MAIPVLADSVRTVLEKRGLLKRVWRVVFLSRQRFKDSLESISLRASDPVAKL
jgi:hypothetical protein